MNAGTLALEKSSIARSQSGAPEPMRARSLGEFLVTGGATLVLIPLAYLYQRSYGLEQSEYIVSFAAFYAAYVINDPHFAVSYLLFYKNAGKRLSGREFQGLQRIRYLIAGFVVPAVLAGWIALALTQQSARTLGAMIQLMFFLVGWHYVKQGFGVLTVLSSRRGTFFTPLERKLILTHCFSGWAYAWSSPRELGGTYEESGVVYTALAHPPGMMEVAGALFALSTVGVLGAAIIRLRRGQKLPPLAATSGLFMSVWLWTVYSGFDPLIAYVIPGLHSLQYWYFVYLLKKNEAKSDLETGKVSPSLVTRLASVAGPIYGRLAIFFVTSVALAWLFFNGIPTFLDETVVATTAKMGSDPEVSTVGLGTTPYVAAFATFINIHHYFMDHVIWRRENPHTRFLKN